MIENEKKNVSIFQSKYDAMKNEGIVFFKNHAIPFCMDCEFYTFLGECSNSPCIKIRKMIENGK